MNPPKKTRVNDPTDDSWRGRGPPFSTSPVSLAEIDEANQPVGWRARGPGPAMGGIASLPKIREITWNNMDSNRFVSKTNGEIHVSTLWRFQYNNNNININNLLFQIYIYIINRLATFWPYNSMDKCFKCTCHYGSKETTFLPRQFFSNRYCSWIGKINQPVETIIHHGGMTIQFGITLGVISFFST